MRVASQPLLGTISRFRSTATRSRGSSSHSSNAASVKPSGTSRSSPLSCTLTTYLSLSSIPALVRAGKLCGLAKKYGNDLSYQEAREKGTGTSWYCGVALAFGPNQDAAEKTVVAQFAVAAVYDRRRSMTPDPEISIASNGHKPPPRRSETAPGDHRPPLQQTEPLPKKLDTFVTRFV